MRNSRYRPGDVIDSVDINEINKALEEIIDYAGFFDGKACAMAVANTGDKTLTNPQYYIDNGAMEGTFPPAIKPGQTGFMLFTRNFS